METVLRPHQPMLMNFHRQAESKRPAKKKPMLRSAWLRTDKADKPLTAALQISAPQIFGEENNLPPMFMF
ncbi:hypothetical protein DRE_04086 [Drechslerella stenobrocha 248]|uniref:Uncharacterized protein n=1 Tax=Drechslerella stenobrocha 248 TaxID=1043628 RepID=W7HTC4_9PEZI|nr:hypothetical protein DRE_04086 [Drechslerella stenobrocha 248]